MPQNANKTAMYFFIGLQILIVNRKFANESIG